MCRSCSLFSLLCGIYYFFTLSDGCENSDCEGCFSAGVLILLQLTIKVNYEIHNLSFQIRVFSVFLLGDDHELGFVHIFENFI